MHLYILSPANVSLGRSASFYLAIACVALLGDVWRCGFSSHKFRLPSGAAGIFPLVGFFFYNVFHITHYLFRKSWGIHSVLEGSPLIICDQRFGGGSEISRNIYDHFRAIWLVCTVRYSWQSPVLFLGFCINPILFGGGLVGLFPLGSLCKRLSGIIGWIAPILRAISREVFSLPSGFVIIWQISYQRAILPSLLSYLLCSHISWYSIN